MARRSIPRDIRNVSKLDKHKRSRVAKLLKSARAPSLHDSLAYALMLLDEHAKLRESKGETAAETETLAHLYQLQRVFVGPKLED